MTFSKGKLVVGGIATYAAAVFVGYQYANSSKPKAIPQNQQGVPVDPKNIVLPDNQRLASFNQHAQSYDSGIVASCLHVVLLSLVLTTHNHFRDWLG